MTTPEPQRHFVEISDEAFDILTRTAETLGTDHNGALHYLMQAPAVPTTRQDDDDKDDSE